MTSFDETNDARIAGKEAYRAGLPQGACAEPPGTIEHRYWHHGWRREQAHHIAMSEGNPVQARDLWGYAVGDLRRAAG